MRDQHQSGRRLPFLEDLSRRERQAIERAADQVEAERRGEDDRRRKGVEALRVAFERDLRGVLDTEAQMDLHDAIGRERLAERDRSHPPLRSRTDDRGARRAAERRLDEVLTGRGTSRRQLRKLSTDLDARIAEVASGIDAGVSDGYHLERNLDKWLSLSSLHQAPLPWGVLTPQDDPEDPHRWFVFRSPFFGFLFSSWSEGTDAFAVNRELYLEPHNGWVGNKLTLDCTDGGFGEGMQARADAQIGFGFVPPITGLVEVIVDAQSTHGIHDVRMSDNFGFSSASAALRNYLTVSFLHPGAPENQLTPVAEAKVTSDGDDVSDRKELSKFQHYFADVVSAKPARANETIVIAVGTRSVDIAGAHRMDVRTVSDFGWFISSVEVRVVP